MTDSEVFAVEVIVNETLADDDYYYSLENYVPTALEPGATMLIVTGFFCAVTMMLVPLLVAYGRRSHAKKMTLESLNKIGVDNGGFHPDDGASNSNHRGPKKLGDVIAERSHAGGASVQSVGTNYHLRRSRARYHDQAGGSRAGGSRAGVRSSKKAGGAGSRSSAGSITSSRADTIASSNTKASTRSKQMSFSDALSVARRAGRRNRSHFCKPSLNVLEDDWQWDKIADNEDAADSVAGSEMYPVSPSKSGWGAASVASSPWDARTAPAVTMANRWDVESVASRPRMALGDMESVIEGHPTSPTSIVPSIHTQVVEKFHDHGGDGNESGPLRIFCGEGAVYSWKNFRGCIDYIVFLSSIDNESKRMWHLAVPLTGSLISGAIFDIIDTLIVAHFMGLNSLAAYTIVETYLGITDCFFCGIVETVSTLAAFAIGSEEYHLAGQYVQIAAIMYTVLSIPVIILFTMYTQDIVLFFGSPPHIAEAAGLLMKWLNWSYLAEGIDSTFSSLLDVAGHETFGAIMDFFFSVLSSICLYVALQYFDADWLILGYMWIILGVTQSVLTVFITYKIGWLDKYKEGMFSSNAMKNTNAVKYVIRTAIPLSIGEFLSYGVWEILIFLVASVGSAELAVWGMIGTIWELLEATTDGISDAASIRVSLHLGRGMPALAKHSAHKVMYYAVLLGFFTTSILFIVARNIPTWFTEFEVIQNIIYETIPLIGLGNLFLVYGMTAWGVVGAQGRFTLSTVTLVCCMWGVTLPYCMVVTLVFNLNLQGIISGLVIGYGTAAVVMSYIVLTSDWNAISEGIIRESKKAAQKEAEEESSSESSSSSSSSESESESDSESQRK